MPPSDTWLFACPEEELECTSAQATRALYFFESAETNWERAEWWAGYTEAIHRILDLVLDRKATTETRQNALGELLQRIQWRCP